jgi:predicted phage terminase large subunit-like protein
MHSTRKPNKKCKGWNSEIADLSIGIKLAQARESFWAFRLWMHPELLVSWWQCHVAQNLQQFYDDFVAAKRPKIVLQAPPQHGKTTQVEDFIAWCAGRNPNLKAIFASYSDDLGIRVNLDLQRLYTNERYLLCFPKTTIADQNVVTQVGRYLRNSSVIEYVGGQGSFRNTTVMGQITGQGLDLGIIDDPIKGRAEASSKVTRDKTWNWFTDDFFSRFSDCAGMLMIMTRWHVDDPIGRWMERFPETKILRYMAIATEDEIYRKKGEALFPAHKSLEFSLERKKLLTEASWEALYQQNPIIVGGGIFPIDKLRVLSTFDRTKISRSVRAWDKGSTPGGGDYTAGVLMHAMKDKSFVIEHVVRGQWSALEREQRIKATAAADSNSIKNWYEIVIEQEPGSSGKETYEATAHNLAGYIVHPDKVTGSKEVRAEPLAAQVQASNVWLHAGPHVPDLLDEFETFPHGSHDDQVDAAAMAFARLTKASKYNTNYEEWVY